MSKWLYSESKLSAATGVSRTDLVKFRKQRLQKFKDWRIGKGQGRAVELAESAIAQILSSFGIKNANLEPARLDSAPAGNGTTPETPLVKVSAICLNTRRINAVDDHGKVFEVLVGNNEVWAIGNPLRVKTSEVNKMYWECAHKPPRYRGDPVYKQANGLS